MPSGQLKSGAGVSEALIQLSARQISTSSLVTPLDAARSQGLSQAYSSLHVEDSKLPAKLQINYVGRLSKFFLGTEMTFFRNKTEG